MKNLIILIILVIAGYFGYTYYGYQFFESSSTKTSSHDYYLNLPQECQNAGKHLQESIDRHEIATKVNGYRKGLRVCLRRAGLSEKEIDEATDNIMGNR